LDYRRDKIVGLRTEEQLEDLLAELGIEAGLTENSVADVPPPVSTEDSITAGPLPAVPIITAGDSVT
jgi:hypothetical protein